MKKAELSESEKQFIRDNFSRMTYNQMTNVLKRGHHVIRKFLAQERLIKDKLRTRPAHMKKTQPTDEQIKFIRENHKSMRVTEIATRLNMTFWVVNQYMRKNGLERFEPPKKEKEIKPTIGTKHRTDFYNQHEDGMFNVKLGHADRTWII